MWSKYLGPFYIGLACLPVFIAAWILTGNSYYGTATMISLFFIVTNWIIID